MKDIVVQTIIVVGYTSFVFCMTMAYLAWSGRLRKKPLVYQFTCTNANCDFRCKSVESSAVATATDSHRSWHELNG